MVEIGLSELPRIVLEYCEVDEPAPAEVDCCVLVTLDEGIPVVDDGCKVEVSELRPMVLDDWKVEVSDDELTELGGALEPESERN